MRIKIPLVFTIFLFILCLESFPFSIKGVLNAESSEINNNLNLVFIFRNYQSRKLKDNDLAIIRNQFKFTKPFDEFKGKINFLKIDISKEEESIVFKSHEEFPYISVHKSIFKELDSKLPGPYKLIMIDGLSRLSCAKFSSVKEMSLIIIGRNRYSSQKEFRSGFFHELGHSFGLRDERTSHCLECSAGPPNCAKTKKEAEELWGDLAAVSQRVDYISGCCGNIDYFRPTIASFMNDPDKANDFGPVNERFLRKELKKLIGEP